MQIEALQERDWVQVKQIYLEAFPKSEQKPFSSLKRGVKRGNWRSMPQKRGICCWDSPWSSPTAIR